MILSLFFGQIQFEFRQTKNERNLNFNIRDGFSPHGTI